MINKQTMTLAAAARYLNAKRATLVRYVSSGDLCAMLIDGCLLFHHPHLDNFVKEQAEKQAADIRRARQATVAADDQAQPASSGPLPPKARNAQRKRAPRQREPRATAPGDNTTAKESKTQLDLPGLGSDLQQPKEPR